MSSCEPRYNLLLFPVIFQGHDKPLRLMQGFFRGNGGCGYVKKPDFLLTTGPNGEVFDPKANLPVRKTLKVDTIYVSKALTTELAQKKVQPRC